jgi:penicillin-binding protein 1A
MGGNFYGIETAAKGYFGKDVRNLTLAESAALTGITNWPNRYMPINEENIEANIERAHLCLRLMLEQELITQAEYDRAKAEKIRFNYNPEAGKVTTTSQQSYFVDEVIRTVKRDLMTQYGYSEQTALSVIYNNGIQVQTTLDPKVQAARTRVQRSREFRAGAQAHRRAGTGAMVVMDPATGAVRGLYGGQGKRRAPSSTVPPRHAAPRAPPS